MPQLKPSGSPVLGENVVCHSFLHTLHTVVNTLVYPPSKQLCSDFGCFDDVICPAMKTDVAEINIGIQHPKHKRQ